VIQKSTANHETPVPRSHERQAERDTLNDTPELRFLRDEIEALLGSASVRRTPRSPIIKYADDHDAVAPEDLGRQWLERATESEQSVASPGSAADGSLESVAPTELEDGDDEEDEESEDEDEDALTRDSFFDRDTEPSVDAKLVEEAVRAAGK